MKIDEIQKSLTNNHQSFCNSVTILEENAFHSKQEGKWDAGEQLLHIYKSIKPLVLAYSLPKFIVGWKFGKSKGNSLPYDTLVQHYQEKLAVGGKAPIPFQPSPLKYEDRKELAQKIMIVIDFINQKIANTSESDLDKYLLPHPLLGKITMREMLYFTMYHASHHEKLVKAGLIN